MSDFSSDPSRLPPAPPPPSSQQSPFGAPGGPPPPLYAPGAPPPPYGYQPAGYPPSGYSPLGMVQQQKPPRPSVAVGSVLLILGAAITVLGCALTWITVDGVELNGFAEEPIGLNSTANAGPAFVLFAVVLAGFGIAQLAARKVLAVAILAVVFASFAALMVIAAYSEVNDRVDFQTVFGSSASFGPGVWVVALGTLVALGGAVATLSKRRAWPTPA
ncbi:MAG: hypothetical protein Q7V88_00500 [Actinomycetota bacterium]|nr:hypothetical protein [Actinomycetota bacterium]